MQPIVVVEDERDVLQMVQEILETDGFSVLPFEAPAGVELLDDGSTHPSLFLMDLMLPGMSGIELAARLREDGFRTEPMVAMSASPQMLREAAASGYFQATISKPFDLMTLLDMVEKYVHVAG